MGYARNNSSDSAPLSNSLRWKRACGRMDICAKSTRASVCRNRDVNFTKHRVSIIDLKIDPLLLSDNSNSRSRNTHPPVPFSFFFRFFISLLFGVRVAGSSTRSNTSYRTKFARNCARVACDFERGVVKRSAFSLPRFCQWPYACRILKVDEKCPGGGREGRKVRILCFFFFFGNSFF